MTSGYKPFCITKKTEFKRNVVKMWGKSTRTHCWWYKHCGTRREIPRKSEQGLAYDPAIPPLGMYPEEMKPTYEKVICSPILSSQRFKVGNQFRCVPTGGRIKKIVVYYSAMRKNKTRSFTT